MPDQIEIDDLAPGGEGVARIGYPAARIFPRRYAVFSRFALSDSAPAAPRTSVWGGLFLALLVAAANVGLWAWINRPVPIANWSGQVEGLAFSAFQRYQSPHQDTHPSDDELASDLRIIARTAKRVRTYSSLESAGIPRLARDLGLNVMAGAWLDRRGDNNEVELEALFSAAHQRYDR